MKEIRLQKYLAASGVASRRKSEELIVQGKVKVNGLVANNLGIKVDPFKDTVMYDNRLITMPRKVYMILNKPKDHITSRTDPRGRKTIYDLLPAEYQQLHAVGRLDRNTTGLLLLTNDGELTQAILHPKYKLSKKYRVVINKPLSKEDAMKIVDGLMLDGKKTLPADLASMDSTGLHLEITIQEGRNRQIRKMFAMLGYDVEKLKRVSIGFLRLGKLRISEYRVLAPSEISRLLKWKLKT